MLAVDSFPKVTRFYLNIDVTDFVKQILMTLFKTASSIEASTEIDTPLIEKVSPLLSGTIKSGRKDKSIFDLL